MYIVCSVFIMENSNLCMICLQIKESLANIANSCSPESSLRFKLEKCIPEIDWKHDYCICLNCTEQLQIAYNFRELCLKSEQARGELKKRVKEELEDEEHSKNAEHEHFSISENNNLPKEGTLAQLIDEFVKLNNEKSEEYFCKYCKKQFPRKNSLIRHEKNCNIKNNRTEAHEEIKIDSETNEKQNKCDLCETSFKDKYLLKRHRRNVHATEKNFKCDQCPSSFVSSVYLNAHKKYHSGDRKHVCSFCGKRYITASDLYHHEKIHQNKRAYECRECDKAFNTSSDLHKHKMCVHMDRNLWKYSCEFCTRKFPLKTNLDTHIKTHTGEKNFSCHLCEKKCISRSALTRHIDSHTNVKSFKCELCDLGYKYKKSLDIHMVKNHGVGDIKIPDKEKRYFCQLCPKSYYANSKLEKHIRSHTGDKPFKCPSCDKCFVDKSYIKQHLRAAHNINVN